MGSRFATSAIPLVVVVVVVVGGAAAEPVEDKKALLDFIGDIPHRPLNWNSSTSACTAWVGITCDLEKSRVVAVRLPGAALSGSIPPNTLSRLSALQTLSLRSNALAGPFPPDFVNLTSLVHLHLQSNGFSGPLPADFSLWRNLTALDLSFNRFNASIPDSLSNASRLASLNLANNNFSGEIPNLHLPHLTYLNLSGNHLQGPIPKSLQKFPSASFSGNNLSTLAPAPPPLLSPPPPPPPPPLLQRPPLQSPSPPTLSPHVAKSTKGIISHSAILGIIVGGCALLFSVIAVLLILCSSRRRNETVMSGKIAEGDRSPEKAVMADQDENNRLVFFEGCTFAFDLEDLLRASAEVLGKGTFGTAYKAALEDSTTVVVKRLKDVGAGKREFEQQMEVVGRIKHENVVELRAYYYSKDEKLLVYDHHSLGSVSAMLHGKRGEDRTPLDWECRLKIALGAARGIAHIHAENNGRLVHGNIKSSNVFLNHQFYGCVSDIGLTTLMNPMISPISRTAGYRAPEVTDSRKATQMSDVYSFGVLLLELLTGRSPIQVIGGGDEIIHLVRWVQSVVREEWTGEVFDIELVRCQNAEEEMVEMLQIAMTCVVRNPDHRPQMVEVMKRIQDVRRVDTGASSDMDTTAAPTPTQGQQPSTASAEPSNHN